MRLLWLVDCFLAYDGKMWPYSGEVKQMRQREKCLRSEKVGGNIAVL
jgi:hypothetical protein